MAKQGDFVDTGGIGDAAGGGALVPGLGEEAAGDLEELLMSIVHALMTSSACSHLRPLRSRSRASSIQRLNADRV
jgi:hypothetical protein